MAAPLARPPRRRAFPTPDGAGDDGGAHLAEIHVYPLKSARGIRLDASTIDPTGLRHDRRWMIVTEEGRFVSQREEPRLALVVPTIEGDALRLSAPDVGDLRVPLEPDGSELGRRPVRIWQDEVRALDAGDEAAAWVAASLGAPHRLVHFPRSESRQVDPQFAREGDRVGFADGYAFLLASAASLADLNDRLDVPVPMDRFRPNLVVRGAAPFEEDGWREVRIGETRFRVVKPCARCVITTVDQRTAAVGREPLRTLAAFRRVGTKVIFGQNLIHEGGGTLREGDALHVVATAP